MTYHNNGMTMNLFDDEIEVHSQRFPVDVQFLRDITFQIPIQYNFKIIYNWSKIIPT